MQPLQLESIRHDLLLVNINLHIGIRAALDRTKSGRAKKYDITVIVAQHCYAMWSRFRVPNTNATTSFVQQRIACRRRKNSFDLNTKAVARLAAYIQSPRNNGFSRVLLCFYSCPPPFLFQPCDNLLISILYASDAISFLWWS